MQYTPDEIYQIAQINLDDGLTIREPRHADWTTNYTLYRDKVLINRITQRQSVNIPLMKYIIKTNIKEVDDLVDIYFRSNSNNKQKEIYLNAAWSDVVKDQKLEVRDIVDKKNVMLYGRSTSDWNIENGKVVFGLDDIFDMVFSRYTDPTNIDGTCRSMHQLHVYTPLSKIQNDKRYAKHKEDVDKLVQYFATEQGLIESEENTQEAIDKNERARQMGDVNVNDPKFGETIVEINRHWIRLWDDEYDEPCIYYQETANGFVLLSERQEDVIGKTRDNYWRSHFIKSSWADDVERGDINSDGLADTIRPINVVANAWFSQDVENRTLRNYNMHYHLTMDGFTPQAYVPRPWGWYELPVASDDKRSINDLFKAVEVPALSDTLPAIQWAIGVAEKAGAASSNQAGQVNQNQVTLGEVELTLAEGKDRVKSMSKFYFPAWEERATKFLKLIEAAGSLIKSKKLYKKSYKGNMFGKEIGPNDWYDEDGYTIEITSKSESRRKALENITILNAVKAAMPLNAPLQDIYEEKMINLVDDITPEQFKQVMDFQKQLRMKGILNPNMFVGAGGPASAGNKPKLQNTPPAPTPAV